MILNLDSKPGEPVRRAAGSADLGNLEAGVFLEAGDQARVSPRPGRAHRHRQDLPHLRPHRQPLHREVHQQHRQLLSADQRQLHPGRDHVQAGPTEEGRVWAGNGEEVHHFHRRPEPATER